MLCSFVTLSLVGGEWSASCPGRFAAREDSLASIQCNGGWTLFCCWDSKPSWSSP